MENQVFYDMIPVLVSKNDSDRWMKAELRSGQHFGPDGEVVDGNDALYLDSGEAFQVFGECYPFGSMNGGDVSTYIRKGAVLKLDNSRSIVRHTDIHQAGSVVFGPVREVAASSDWTEDAYV